MKKNELTKLLFNQYGKLLLTRAETAQTLGISTCTLDRMRTKGLGPKWQKENEKAKNSKVSYTISDVAEYVASRPSNLTYQGDHCEIDG